MSGLRVVIVGSGFAGSILARILKRQGHEVLLVERSTHPRFALGESSTPLAAICLERMAQRYDLEDLRHLAAYGRWLTHMPDVRRGLKRGFTFYDHRPGQPFRNDAVNRNRLLVAASPNDLVADSHWLREDVDHFLVCKAEAEGVEYLDHTALTELDARPNGFRLSGNRLDKQLSIAGDLVVDASGGSGFLARQLPIRSRLQKIRLRTGLVFGHFEGVRPFAEVIDAAAQLPDGPYPDERAAVHHMLDEGWMYQLPFDHGVVSAGFVCEAGTAWRGLTSLEPESAWRRLLERYPTLHAQFADARALRPVGVVTRLQRRLEHAAGYRWVLLPHAFCFLSPMFSTGIAWSLLAVERLGLLLEPFAGSDASGSRLQEGLERYGDLLERETDYLQRLIAGAYRARHDFDVFAAYTYLYFAAASYAEASQRLLPAPSHKGAWAWDGFLGSSDPKSCDAVAVATALLRMRGRAASARKFASRYFDQVRRLIAPRNLAGLADPERNRLYPVDLEILVASANLLDLSREEIRRELPRLRGGGRQSKKKQVPTPSSHR